MANVIAVVINAKQLPRKSRFLLMFSILKFLVGLVGSKK